jgi:hypothetical protein
VPTTAPSEPPVSADPSVTAAPTATAPTPIPFETDPSSSVPPATPINGNGGVDLQQVILGAGLVAGALLALLALGRRRARGGA